MSSKNTIQSRIIGKVLTSSNVQKTVLTIFNNYYNMLNFIYVVGGVATTNSLKTLFKEYDYYENIEALKMMKLIKVEGELVIIENRGIQIVEAKSIIDEVSSPVNFKRFKKNLELEFLDEKCIALANVCLKADINLEVLMYRLTHAKDTFLTQINTSKGTLFPNKNVFECTKNTTTQVLLKSDIFFISRNKVFIYIKNRDKDRVVTDLVTRINFLKENYADLTIYTNINNSLFIDIACNKACLKREFIKSIDNLESIILRSTDELIMNIKDSIAQELNHICINYNLNNTNLDIYNKLNNKAIIFTDSTSNIKIQNVNVLLYKVEGDSINKICSVLLDFLN